VTIAGVLGGLLATNVLLSAVVPSWGYIPAILAAAVLAVLAARRGGATLDDLGLAIHRARRSLLIGLGIGGVIAAVVGIGLTVPWFRDFFADERFADLGVGALAYQALVRIPLGTAVGEELLFRSVGLGIGLRRWSLVGAVAGSSALFGLWHILPALDSHASNPVATSVPVPLLVAGTVAITALAGVGFSWLRIWTGHVAAPLVAHATLNASALMAAAAIAA
jgi:membrane protease YdiL (CAAX protease family)